MDMIHETVKVALTQRQLMLVEAALMDAVNNARIRNAPLEALRAENALRIVRSVIKEL